MSCNYALSAVIWPWCAGLPANPLAGLRAGKSTARRTADGLDDADLLGLKKGDAYDDVTRAIIALGYESGPRTSELVAMNVSDFIVARSDSVALGPALIVAAPAKVDRERLLPLGVRAAQIVREVVAHRAAGPLFPGRDGRRVTSDALQSRIARAGRRIGIELSPQRLRRTAASWQSAYGASSGHLDTVFGWAPNPADVKSGHYVIPTVPQLLFAHQTRLSPLDRLELRTGTAIG